eukprot:454352_1
MSHRDVVADASLQVFIRDPRSSPHVDVTRYVSEMGFEPTNSLPKEISTEDEEDARRFYLAHGRKLTVMCRSGIPELIRGGVWLKLMVSNCKRVGTVLNKLQLESSWLCLQKEVLLEGGPCMFPSLGNDGTEDYLDETVLSIKGKAAAIRVLHMAKCLLAIKWCPSLLDIVPMLIIFMPESCAYTIVENMWCERPLFFPSTQVMQEVWSATFGRLVDLYIPGLSRLGRKCGALTPSQLSCIFQRLFAPILQLCHRVQMWDSWLSEGFKALHRYGLALLLHFQKRLKNLDHHPGRSEKGWWGYIKDWTHEPDFDFKMVHTRAYSLKRHFLSPSLSWDEINELNKEYSGIITRNINRKLSRSTSSHCSSSPSDRRGNKATIGTPSKSAPPPSLLQAVGLPNSELLSEYKYRAIVSEWVPQTLLHRRLHVVYSTELFGFSMMGFLMHCRGISPCLLVVESAKGAVFGAFLVEGLLQYSPKFDVTQDFLFHLKPRQPTAFHCIAPSPKENSHADKYSSGDGSGASSQIKKQHHTFRHVKSHQKTIPEGGDHSCMESFTRLRSSHNKSYRHSVENRNSRNLRFLEKGSLIMTTREMLAIGISRDSDACGLVLYDDLQKGSSRPCPIFGNEGLAKLDEADFDVACCEVFEFVE